MISRILNLIKHNNLNAKSLETNTGLPNGSITAWKKGRAKPSSDAVIKIAEYFNVSTDYILLGKECNSNLSDVELELLDLFRQLSSDRQKERFLGKAELLIKEMTELDMKKGTGN